MIDYQKKRPAIGFMTGNLHLENPRHLISEVCRSFQDMDADLHLYLGADPLDTLDEIFSEDVGFDCHSYSLQEYSKYDDLDLLIVSFRGLIRGHGKSAFEEFLARLPDVPLIMTEYDTGDPTICHVLFDNYSGMKECVSHLITVHGCRHIAYISGPAANQDAARRKAAYIDALKEYGIPVREEYILQGDFTEQVEDAVVELLDQYGEIDAVVAANDKMAVAAQRAVVRIGKTVGEDIAVTGFDDVPRAQFLDAPLTTVSQDIRQMAEALAATVKKFLSGEPLCDCVLPAKLQIRSSCGCRWETALDERERWRGQILWQMDAMHSIELESMQNALILRNLLIRGACAKEFFENLGQQFRRIGIKKSCIYLLEEPLVVENGKTDALPDTMKVFLLQQKERIAAYDRQTAPDVQNGGLRALLESDEPVQMMDFMLFYQNVQFGVLSIEANPAEVFFYYTLSIEIGSALHYLRMAMEQQELHARLREKNQILDYSASHDELTEIYNRTGVMSYILSFVRGCEEGTRFVALMADLDHLKQINDTFGHAEGDHAIKTAAKILKTALPNLSPLGRTGGDEFTAVFALSQKASQKSVKEKIYQLCQSYNSKMEKPYFIEISVGMTEFSHKELARITRILKYADHNLYEAKQLRRDNVVRGRL